MPKSTIRFTTFPRTEPPPVFVPRIVDVFETHEALIGTEKLEKHLTSDSVLEVVSSDLSKLGFQVERGKRKHQKIERPVFFGENGVPTLKFEVDAFHEDWKCGLEVEAIRAIGGGAVFRDLIQALVMVHVDHLCLAVPNIVRWGKNNKNRSYDETIHIAQALFGHSRMQFPYALTVIGY